MDPTKETPFRYVSHKETCRRLIAELQRLRAQELKTKEKEICEE